MADNDLNKRILQVCEELGEKAPDFFAVKPGTIAQWKRTGQPSFKAAQIFFERFVARKTVGDGQATAEAPPANQGADHTQPKQLRESGTVPPPGAFAQRAPAPKPQNRQPQMRRPVSGPGSHPRPNAGMPTGAETPGVMIDGVFYPYDQAPRSRGAAAPMMAVDPNDPNGMNMPVSMTRPASGAPFAVPPRRNPGITAQPGPQRPGGGPQLSPHLMAAFMQFLTLMGYVQPEEEGMVATVPLRPIRRPRGWNGPHFTPGGIDGYPAEGQEFIVAPEEQE